MSTPKQSEGSVILNFLETFAINAALAVLSAIEGKVKNQTELAALQGASAFLQRLLTGAVSTT